MSRRSRTFEPDCGLIIIGRTGHSTTLKQNGQAELCARIPGVRLCAISIHNKGRRDILLRCFRLRESLPGLEANHRQGHDQAQAQ